MALGLGIAIFARGFLFVAQTCQTPRVADMHLPFFCGLVPQNACLTSFFFLTFCESLRHPFCPCRQMFSLSSCSGHLPQPSMRRAKLLRRLRSRFVRDWGVIFICQTFIPARDALLPSVMHSFPINKKLTLTCTNVTEKKRSLSGLCSVFHAYSWDEPWHLQIVHTSYMCYLQLLTNKCHLCFEKLTKDKEKQHVRHLVPLSGVCFWSSEQQQVDCLLLKIENCTFSLLFRASRKKPKTINVSDILADN